MLKIFDLTSGQEIPWKTAMRYCFSGIKLPKIKNTLFLQSKTFLENSLALCITSLKMFLSFDYQTNNNDQAVVEICITRITTAIRETESIEKHAKALVGLWDSCLEHNLRPSGKDEDTPHAKIASDIMSCILQVVKYPPAMQKTLVQFLGREDPLEKGQATHSSILGLPW
ncbi:hypothetical protein FD755_014677 [Muntiacus reevesi]|uniref:Uncharacterized protein n=1 Tax=Muntiacus reevesi TaxID=9886 RepID=A0A5N3XKP3_MUNRE|nr:hypothetical protein FD755_014677 [Muntiacus reevesi]